MVPEGRQLAYKIFEAFLGDARETLMLKNNSGDPLIASLLMECNDAEQWEQFLEFVAKFRPSALVQLLNLKDHNGKPLIELFGDHMDHTPLAMQFMEILVNLRDAYEIRHINSRNSTTNPTLAKMFEIVGVRYRQ
jgi:hypothetical protein